MKVGETVKQIELTNEINRLKEQFAGSDNNKLNAMEALIEQAAYERIYLRRLNNQALITGLVKVHPNNPEIQQILPVSGEITKHSATLTSITDKLMKYLAVDSEEKDDGLGEYE